MPRARAHASRDVRRRVWGAQACIGASRSCARCGRDPARRSSRAQPEGESSYFSNITRITNGGANAEAYWSFDNTKLTFQVRGRNLFCTARPFSRAPQAQVAPYNSTHPCDLIYNMNVDGRCAHRRASGGVVGAHGRRATATTC